MHPVALGYMCAKIYTKVGDQGETVLIGGQKVSKDDVHLRAYGTIDELSSAIGFVSAGLKSQIQMSTGLPSARLLTAGAQSQDVFVKLLADLECIQHWLFDLGSLLASQPSDRVRYKLPPLRLEQIEWLENRIDGATAVLKPIKEFILPAGTEVSARFHLARTICRRAERNMMGLKKSDLPEHAIPFINRLSDYLFTMARLANHVVGQAETTWKKSSKAI